MKKIIFTGTLALLVSFISCEKKEVEQVYGTMTATINPGGGSFTATSVTSSANPNTIPRTFPYQLSIEGRNASNEYISIVFRYTGTTGTVNITAPLTSSNAVMAYHKAGAAGDDIALSGSITVTAITELALNSSHKKIDGTFDFITQSNAHVTGNFTVFD
jgi:hypothetical protein